MRKRSCLLFYLETDDNVLTRHLLQIAWLLCLTSIICFLQIDSSRGTTDTLSIISPKEKSGIGFVLRYRLNANLDWLPYANPLMLQKMKFAVKMAAAKIGPAREKKRQTGSDPRFFCTK